jgi:hypothetical protein
VGATSTASSSESRLQIFFDGLLVDIADWFELLREHQQGRIQVDEALGGMRAGLRCRLSGSLDRARYYPTGCFERSWYSLRNPKEPLLAYYFLNARRHAPGLTPTMRVKCCVK